MIQLSQYKESWELVRKWIKLLDKHIPRGIVTYYGGFYRGEIKKKDGGWKEVILVYEDYDIQKQRRTGRDHFMEQAITKGFDPSYTARACFLTPEIAKKYYDEHQKIGVREFKGLLEWGDARYFKGRRFTILYEGGLEYDTI